MTARHDPDEAASVGDGPPLLDELLRPRPEARMLGRYTVLDVMGRGGMGLVLRAYDRDLGRTVALKVLHPGLDARRKRMLRREAQAMARLSHPNVVQVYEVGEVEEQIFVAMELVEGQTLREWMKGEPPPDWRACVRLFIPLGDGLAAAHSAGMVHRDFKPDNAIIDDDGRPRVLDFGLARPSRDDEVGSEGGRGASSGSADAVSFDQPLTRTGDVAGTPGYMPLEQMEGREVDARSDQFSFCASLYEAVYGERPYEGRSLMALFLSLRAGEVRPAPKDRDVPVALRKVLVRGLATDPELRWPSMEALLEQLRSLVAPRRWRWTGLAVGAGLVVVGGSLGVVRTLEWLNRCTGAQEQLVQVWDESTRAQVEAAFRSSGASYGEDTWDRIAPRLDDYAQEWIAAHTEACEATEVRRELSEEVRTLRMACLQDRRLRLRATVDVLSAADATTVKNAVAAVASLPSLSRCADVEALEAEVPPPEDPQAARAVAGLEERLAMVEAHLNAGSYVDGLRGAESVVVEAEALGYEPLLARAWLRTGRLQDHTGDYEGAAETLRRAYDAAQARRMTAEAADASRLLVVVLGDRLARYEEAQSWVVHSDPLSRAVGTDEARAEHLGALGMLLREQGEYEEAQEAFSRALELRERALGSDHPEVARSLSDLGAVAREQGEYDRAHDFHQRALALLEHALGPTHPYVADALDDLGAMELLRTNYEAAEGHHERALAIREKALGPQHPAVAASFTALGTLAHSRGELGEARELFGRALAILEDALGPEHPDLAAPLGRLTTVAENLGELDVALEHALRVLSILEKALGPEHPDVADCLEGLAFVTQARQELDEARGYHERAIRILEKTLGPEHPDLADPLNNLGNVAGSQGRLDEARRHHRRGLAIREKAMGRDHPDVAPSLVNLASLARQSGDLEEARELQERALRVLEKALGPEHPHLAYPLTGIGNVLVDLGRAEEALAPLERAHALRTANEINPGALADTGFALARALWSAPRSGGRDRARARNVAEQARKGFVAMGPGKAAELAELDAWVAERESF